VVCAEADQFFVEAVEGYRKSMGLGKIAVMGHSMGGYIAATYALTYPQHTDKIVMVAPYGRCLFLLLLLTRDAVFAGAGRYAGVTKTNCFLPCVCMQGSRIRHRMPSA